MYASCFLQLFSKFALFFFHVRLFAIRLFIGGFLLARVPWRRPGTVATLAAEGDVDGVAAVSWGRDRIDLFWTDAARALWHRSFDGGWAAQ